MRRVLIVLLVLLMTVSGATTAFAAEPPELPHVKAAILYEETTDTILLELNADEQLAPASMTKVMTAILVLEQNPELTGQLTVPEDAVSSKYCGWMDVNRLIAGEEISYQDCMQYLLIPSGNEAATTFAFVVGGTMENFVEMMNAKAAELGCENTNFQEPTGLGGIRHYTSPRDMMKICQYAMTFPKFREIVKMERGTVPASNVRDVGFDYLTTNRILRPGDNPLYQSPYQPYMVGIKTGSTDEAGYCFSGCMEKDGLVFYSVTMRGEEVKVGDYWALGDFLDTITMYDYASQFAAQGPDPADCNATAFSLLGAKKVALTVPENARLLVEKGAQVEASYQAPAMVLGTVQKGDAVGTVTLTSGDTTRTFDMVAAESCSLSPLVLLVVALIAAAIFVVVRRRKKN